MNSYSGHVDLSWCALHQQLRYIAQTYMQHLALSTCPSIWNSKVQHWTRGPRANGIVQLAENASLFSKYNFNKLCFCFLNSFLEYTMIHQMPFKWWKTKWNIMICWSITPSWLQMIQLGRNALGRDFMGYSDKSRSWCIASRGAPRLKETNLTHLIGSYINPPKPTDF